MKKPENRPSPRYLVPDARCLFLADRKNLVGAGGIEPPTPTMSR